MATRRIKLDTAQLKPMNRDGLKNPWSNGLDGTALNSIYEPANDLATDLIHTRTPTTRSFADATGVKAIRDHVTRLPEPGETMHLIVSGRYQMADLIPALIELGGQPIAELQVSTYAFSRDNAEVLTALVRDGQVKRFTLLIAEVFGARNPHIFNDAAAALTALGATIKPCRTHAKIINARLADGRPFTAEASCNLRSARSIENVCLSSDEGLYQFHEKWMSGITAKQKDRK